MPQLWKFWKRVRDSVYHHISFQQSPPLPKGFQTQGNSCSWHTDGLSYGCIIKDPICNATGCWHTVTIIVIYWSQFLAQLPGFVIDARASVTIFLRNLHFIVQLALAACRGFCQHFSQEPVERHLIADSSSVAVPPQLLKLLPCKLQCASKSEGRAHSPSTR